FPWIIRLAIDVGAVEIYEEMKIAAARAIADLIAEDELRPDYVIPAPFDPRVAPSVAAAVAKAAMDTGMARIQVDTEKVYERTLRMNERIPAEEVERLLNRPAT